MVFLTDLKLNFFLVNINGLACVDMSTGFDLGNVWVGCLKGWMFVLINQPARWPRWPRVNLRYLCDIWQQSLLGGCCVWQGLCGSFYMELIPTAHPALWDSLDRPGISRKSKMSFSQAVSWNNLCFLQCCCQPATAGMIITRNPCLNPKSPQDAVGTQRFRTP